MSDGKKPTFELLENKDGQLFASLRIVDEKGEGSLWELFDASDDGSMDLVRIAATQFRWSSFDQLLHDDEDSAVVYFPRSSINFEIDNRSDSFFYVQMKANVESATYLNTTILSLEEVDLELIEHVVAEANEFTKSGLTLAF